MGTDYGSHCRPLRRQPSNVSNLSLSGDGTGMGTTFGPFLDPRIDRCGFLPKRFQQAVVVDGTGMRTPTIGDFHGLRRDRCGFFSQAISASRRGGRNRTQTSGRFLDRRLDRCGFFPSDFSKPVIDRTG